MEHDASHARAPAGSARCFHFLAAFLLATSLCAEPSGTVRGRVVDESGAAIVGAHVTLYALSGLPAGVAETNEEGKFEFSGLRRGRYELRATYPGLQPAAVSVDTAPGGPVEAQLTLRIGARADSVTVTALRGLPEGALTAPNGVSIVSADEGLLRPALILPQILRGEPGVQLQQTTTHQGAILIRGLTGQQVLHLIDGVRFNNSTFRPGPNQYLATVDPGFVEQLEVSRGPNSMQYGSDSLGGTLNLLPPRPFSDTAGRKFHGELAPLFRSADLAAGSSLRLSYGSGKWHVLGGGSYRRGQDLRAGEGHDSHAAVTRFLGLPSGILGDRLQDTAFTQWAGYLRGFWNVRADQTLSLTYHRGEQLGGRRYDQLNGGNGNLINSFDPQVLDFFYARYEKQRLGWLDSLQGTFSYNRQRDARRFQAGSGNPLATITQERNATSAFGYQLQGTTHLGSRQVLQFGGEAYDEFIASAAENLDPRNGAGVFVRARFPDGSRYTSFGLFGQHIAEWFSSRFRTQAGVRLSGIRFRTFSEQNPFVGGQATVPDLNTAFHDATFQAGAAYRALRWLTLYASVSRGFRAPNVSDFAQVGLSSNGFEVSPQEAIRANALVGTSADSTAISSGRRVAALSSEALWDFEGGLRLKAGCFSGSLGGFHYGLQDFITKRTLILPLGAVGETIGGATIIAQLPSGAVVTALDSRPVITRLNIGQVRLRGFEAEARLRVTSAVMLSGNVSYLRGVDVGTGGPPDIEGGLPPLHGLIALRWQRASKPLWMETFVHWSDRQDRLSSIELADQRIGATRSRDSIASFFANGAVARGLVAGGILLPTGETLAQVQDRVLGPGVAGAPLFRKTPGFATLNLRGGYRLGEHSDLLWVFENVLDKNYRLHGSGVDSAGRNLQLTYLLRF